MPSTLLRNLSNILFIVFIYLATQVVPSQPSPQAITQVSDTLVAPPASVVVQPTDPDLPWLQRYIKKVCKKDCVDAATLLHAIRVNAIEFKVNPITLLALAKVESSFKQSALNTKSGKSVGLMQIQVYWHKDKFKGSDYHDIGQNVRAGTIIYRDCVRKWNNDRDNALWCYNGHQADGKEVYVPKVKRAIEELMVLQKNLVNIVH